MRPLARVQRHRLRVIYRAGYRCAHWVVVQSRNAMICAVVLTIHRFKKTEQPFHMNRNTKNVYLIFAFCSTTCEYQVYPTVHNLTYTWYDVLVQRGRCKACVHRQCVCVLDTQSTPQSSLSAMTVAVFFFVAVYTQARTYNGVPRAFSSTESSSLPTAAPGTRYLVDMS